MIRDESEDYDFKLTEWLAVNLSKTAPLSTFYCNYTGDSCDIVDMFYKTQIRSLVEFLFDLEKQGHCLSHTAFSDLSNLVVREDVIKFPTTSVVKYTSDGFTRSFQCLAKFIMNTFFKTLEPHNLPVEFRYFMAHLLSPDRKSETLLRHHISLMGPNSIGRLVTAMDQVKHQFTAAESVHYHVALDFSNDVHTWMERLKLDNDRGLFQKCFDKSKYTGIPEDRTRFFRNCIARLIKYCRMGCWEDEDPRFEIHDVPMILFARYGDMIARIFEDLHRFRLLYLIKPEKCF